MQVEKGAFSSREWSAIAASKPKMSIVSQTGTLKDAEEGPPAKAESKFCKCLSKLHVIQKMLDISLLASPTFLLISVSGAVTMAGFFVPFIFLKRKSVSSTFSWYFATDFRLTVVTSLKLF